MDDGSVDCWGEGSWGKTVPPSGPFRSVSAAKGYSCYQESSESAAGKSFSVSCGGADHTCGVRVDGSVSCWGDDRTGQSSPPVGEFRSVSAGGYHTCGVRVGGTLACWGNDWYGQAAVPEGEFQAVSAGGSHTCALGIDGGVLCWGSNGIPGTFSHACRLVGALAECVAEEVSGGEDSYGQAESPEGLFVSVSAGNTRTCGLREGGELECWGNTGAWTVDPPAGVAFREVSSAAWRRGGVAVNNEVHCWGEVPGLGGGAGAWALCSGARRSSRSWAWGLPTTVCWGPWGTPLLGDNRVGQVATPRGPFEDVSPVEMGRGGAVLRAPGEWRPGVLGEHLAGALLWGPGAGGAGGGLL